MRGWKLLLGHYQIWNVTRSEYIWRKSSKRVYSKHFYQVYPRENIMFSGCLYAFVRSEAAFKVLRSISAGTKLQIQKHDLLLGLPIPYPECEKIREEIHNLVFEGYEQKNLAIDYENQTRTLVEEAIENGGC